MQSDTVQIITTALALLGAVLGVFNAWRSWIKDRVTVRVNASLGMSGKIQVVVVEVLNLSSFPITITHIGFFYLDTLEHSQVLQPHFAQGQTLPVRLESRANCTSLHPITANPNARWEMVANAYVKTACGLTQTSGSAAFDMLRVTSAAED